MSSPESSAQIAELKAALESERILKGALQAQVAEIVHDFNNILGLIAGHCELVLDGLTDTNPLRAQIEKLSLVVERAVSINQKLRKIGRAQEIADLANSEPQSAKSSSSA